MLQTSKWQFGDYLISTDKSLLSIDSIANLLSKSYWAKERKVDVIQKSISNSQCYGLYFESQQVGFARVVSDFATVYWICDVIVDEAHRGKGLGKKLIECIVNTEEFLNIRGILATSDAHGLYEQFGFQKDQGRFMRR